MRLLEDVEEKLPQMQEIIAMESQNIRTERMIG